MNWFRMQKGSSFKKSRQLKAPHMIFVFSVGVGLLCHVYLAGSVHGTFTSFASTINHPDTNAITQDVHLPTSNQRIFTVFSSGCSPYQDWQAQTLLHSHRTLGVRGDLVRLMSCSDLSYELPQHSYEKYRVVRVPDFDLFHPDDKYSARNKPNAHHFWMNGWSNDKDLPQEDDVLILIDTDMVFLHPDFSISSVRRGFAIAAKYRMGSSWVTDWAKQFCQGTCDEIEDGYDPSFGYPLVLTGGDMKRHAEAYVRITENMRKVHKGWITEMYSTVMAFRVLGIKVDVRRTMISNPTCPEEPWSQTDLDPMNMPRTSGVWVSHYCQNGAYKVGSFEFSKKKHMNLDIRKCNVTENLPVPEFDAERLMKHFRGKPLKLTPQSNKDEVVQARRVWLIDNTWLPAKEAIDAYYAEFCY